MQFTKQKFSNSQRHNDIFVIVIRITGDIHKSLTISVFEFKRDSQTIAVLL